MSIYIATVNRVIDGDTYDVTAYLGLGVTYRTKVRLLGVNCPERFTPEGQAATERAKQLLEGKQVRLATEQKVDKYGRLLAGVVNS